MIKVRTVIRDADNRVQGGVNFFWTRGMDTVLYQSWEHKGSGPIWNEVAPDPMSGTNFLDYLHECWSEYELVDIQEDYR